MPVRATDLDPDTRKRLSLDRLSTDRLSIDGAPIGSIRRKKSADSVADDLFARQLVLYGLPAFERQYRFPQSLHPNNKRKRWRADYCNQDYMLMVEIDGGIFSYGAHGHPVDITRNMMKQNDAALLGFATLRFATTWVKNKHAIEFLQRYLATKGWRPNA